MSEYAIVQKITRKMETGATMWMIIGIFQVLIGVAGLLVCVGFTSILVGIWNIVQSTRQSRNAKYFRQTATGIYSYYESNMAIIIVFVFINLFLGSVIGVIGSIYELTIYSFVKNHKNELLEIERNVQARMNYQQ